MDEELGEQGVTNALRGQVVAVPETRQLDILEELLTSRGATVRRVPLVAILDAPDPRPIEAWLKHFIATPPEYFIILTGEGLRRLRGFAERADCEAAFISALKQVCKICRGPKPGRALKEIDMKPDMLGKAPTTPGIIAALEELALEGRRVAVQLYGEEPNRLLMDYLQTRGAIGIPVAPYIYAPRADEEKILALIDALASGEITMMTFTSQPQYARLTEVAKRHNQEQRLHEGLAKVSVAAVGPVVADQLRAAGVEVAVMPESLFFMKPMVTELVKLVRSRNSTPRSIEQGE